MTELICRTCGSDKLYPIKGRRSLSCPKGHHTSPIADTPMKKSRTEVENWEWLFKVLRKNQRVPAKRIEQMLGVTYKTAWRMKKLIITNLALFDNHFNTLVDEGWDENPQWLEQQRQAALEALEHSITVGMEFNYRKAAEEAHTKIISKLRT